eukprot:2894781-Prymnesium_polylepis.1
MAKYAPAPCSSSHLPNYRTLTPCWIGRLQKLEAGPLLLRGERAIVGKRLQRGRLPLSHQGDALAKCGIRVAIEAGGRGRRKELLRRVADGVQHRGRNQQLRRRRRAVVAEICRWPEA